MTPSASVVVPAFNNAAYIERTMHSILAQTYADLEIIVADHSSTDDTWRLLQPFADDPRVTLMQTEPGGGALANWNRVSRAASGDFVKLVCGDDLVSPGIVEAQVTALVANPTATLAASARDIIDAHDRPVVRGRGLSGLSGLVSGPTALRRTVVAGTNIFGEPACVTMRRSALETAGWWDSRFPYLIDEATYARVLLLGDLVVVPGSLAGFRVSDAQWSVRLARQQSTQAVAFHEALAEREPGLLSAADLMRGNSAARAMALVRRAAYLVLARRMRRRAA